ncbi:GyrI-like domain-containing protein [Neobacillus sp. MM2021_6]|uniref:GyrI-like domain-containing protein n=1 Tax=Bacillaceae TaxID=186817 RepID=UPI00140A1200|nr:MULTISPECIES: GyrI-like domain-containing protein [Bacillaceae]MBO0959671.1 GyrI-like domain-containing protein [Neobacillus sp. MM2021_6]NHC19781.1 GyrI-like domain-containing protein [Bacillus sp. MM2020_4]
MTTLTIKHMEELTLTGYSTIVPMPTMENVEDVSKQKSAHFGTLAQSGKFAALMAGSRDKIGYAVGTTGSEGLSYFAGANTATVAEDAEQLILPATDYVVLTAEGAPSRQLFDQLIRQFFGEILPNHPELKYEDTYVIEMLLNGNPMDAVVELAIPVKVK